jgi:hypothetical protein
LPPVAPPLFHNCSIPIGPKTGRLNVASSSRSSASTDCRRYGRTLEIDHIVSLELGGSNAIANLFPEKADAHPGYRAKDRLENALHGIVCRGAMRLRTVQRRIAANWQQLYSRVFGVPPPR